MSAQVGETKQVLGGDGDKYEVGLKLGGGRKRSSDEELSLVATKSLKPSDEEEIKANINTKLPPELLSAIFSFLHFSDLKNALLVCR